MSREIDPLIIALARRRIELGLTQGDVAVRARISQCTVNAFETGRRSATMHSIRSIADALGVDLAVVNHGGAA